MNALAGQSGAVGSGQSDAGCTGQSGGCGRGQSDAVGIGQSGPLSCGQSGGQSDPFDTGSGQSDSFGQSGFGQLDHFWDGQPESRREGAGQSEPLRSGQSGAGATGQIRFDAGGVGLDFDGMGLAEANLLGGGSDVLGSGFIGMGPIAEETGAPGVLDLLDLDFSGLESTKTSGASTQAHVETGGAGGMGEAGGTAGKGELLFEFAGRGAGAQAHGGVGLSEYATPGIPPPPPPRQPPPPRRHSGGFEAAGSEEYGSVQLLGPRESGEVRADSGGLLASPEIWLLPEALARLVAAACAAHPDTGSRLLDSPGPGNGGRSALGELCRGLSAAEKEVGLPTLLRTVRMRAGELLLRHREEGTFAVLLLQGCVVEVPLSHSGSTPDGLPGGSELEQSGKPLLCPGEVELGAGAVVGEMALFHRGSRASDVRAGRGGCLVALLPFSALEGPGENPALEGENPGSGRVVSPFFDGLADSSGSLPVGVGSPGDFGQAGGALGALQHKLCAGLARGVCCSPSSGTSMSRRRRSPWPSLKACAGREGGSRGEVTFFLCNSSIDVPRLEAHRRTGMF
ncbi:hypothetical protein T492DRAFT_548342 [Pavlovales sp. CCMP2436]|nr:hypothetical protein T492DRAFT_548342 [Pavlovales sp. CCMP2436]